MEKKYMNFAYCLKLQNMRNSFTQNEKKKIVKFFIKK